jgi:hypothetical protein
MSKYGALKSVRVDALSERQDSTDPTRAVAEPSRMETQSRPHALFRAVWYSGNILLIFAVMLAAYSAVWEYSTRKYLKGFSDAVVPYHASTETRVEAILRWMSEGPARQLAGPASPDRDPVDTLNYASLLQICGSATNAFVNLADSAGIPARRLLLLDSRQMTMHVVAEVLIDGRWIVVDPTFRSIFRGSDGGLLTREQLVDPAVFSAATQGVRGYLPEYTFDHTVHVRIARLGLMAQPLRRSLNLVLPGWEDSSALSLLLERESLATMVAAIILVFLLTLLRVGLRGYGERRLGIRPIRVRQQVRQALQAFADTRG